MKKYSVEVLWRYVSVDWAWIEVEASDEEEARKKAIEEVQMNGWDDPSCEIVDGEPYETDEVREIK